MITTRNGHRVNSYSGLCPQHSDEVAQQAAYWTDDDKFADDPLWPDTERFLMIQKTITNARASCREHCGRSES